MIRVERDDGVAWIRVDRPEARNAMTFAMYDRLEAALAELEAAADLRALVVAGGPEAFVAGTDIAEFRAFADGEDGLAYEARMERLLVRLEDVPVPTIAAIRGVCTGGGVALAAACDLRVGGPSMRVGVPIARTLGNCLSLGNVARLAALVGLDAAKALLLTGRLAGADEALRLGFLSELTERDEEVEPRAAALAAQIAGLAPLTLRTTKEMARRLRDAQPLPHDEDLVRACYASADFRNGRDAFLAKRKPVWTGS